MAEVVLKVIGEEKVKVIKLIRDVTGFGLKEAKDIADEVESGQEYVIAGIAEEDVPKLINDFMVIGAYVESVKTQGTERTAAIGQQALDSFEPTISTNDISKLDRQGTMEVLAEVKKIAVESERYDSEIADLYGKIRNERKKAEEIRSELSGKAWTIILGVTVLAAIIGTFMAPVVMTVILGIVAYFIVYKIVSGVDLKKHEEENNAKADDYILKNVEPLQIRLNEIYTLRDSLNNSEKLNWAIDVIGKDLFYSACIDDIYNLIKSRRADSLKEALNKYDDEQHKARMEEMQQAIQNASEVTAAESVKQTAYSKDIAKSSHQAATAAKATAYHTRRTAQNTKKIAKNTRSLRK